MNMHILMKQAKEMQAKVEKAQEMLANKEYNGSAGGGMVEVIIDGKGFMKQVKLASTAVNANEIEMLEDLIVAAFNDAKRKQDDDSQGTMGEIMGSMKLPGGYSGASGSWT
jgi:DNA-binding YbaB/EbfC family protein